MAAAFLFSAAAGSIPPPQLSNENQRLKTHGKCQEDDREFLVRQIVALKKENSRLHKDLEKVALSSLKSTLNTSPGPVAAVAASGSADPGESIAKRVPAALPIQNIAPSLKVAFFQVQGRCAAAAAASGCRAQEPS